MNLYPIRGIEAIPLEEVRTMPHLKRPGVYCIVSPSMKKYFGQSNNIYNRILQYINQKGKGQRALSRSFAKYGIDQHRFCVVEFCESSQLNNVESFYIKFYDTWKTGLNLTTGGDHYKISDETRELKRQQLLMNNPMRGKTHTDEVKKKLSELSKAMSPESRERGRLARIGMKFSAETIRKRSEKLMGHPVSDSVKETLRLLRSKPVLQFDLAGNLIAEYSSAKDARLKTGVGSVQHCAAGRYKQAGGFIWKYKNDIK